MKYLIFLIKWKSWEIRSWKCPGGQTFFEKTEGEIKKTVGEVLVKKMLQIPCKRDENKSTSKHRAMTFQKMLRCFASCTGLKSQPLGGGGRRIASFIMHGV